MAKTHPIAWYFDKATKHTKRTKGQPYTPPKPTETDWETDWFHAGLLPPAVDSRKGGK